MQITHSFNAPLNHVPTANSTHDVPVASDAKASSLSTIDEVSLSSFGKISQKIDSLFEQADTIYQSHITPSQQKTLNDSYQKLDELFSKNSPSDHQQKSADLLFDKIDNIFEQAEKKLTPMEEEQLETINIKLDELLGAEDIQLGDIMNEDIDKLFQQSENLLTSKLTTQQKKSLDELNQQLSSLFEKNKIDEEGVENIFSKIDNIIGQGYEKLTNKEKDKLDNLDSQIDELFKELDQNEVENNYP